MKRVVLKAKNCELQNADLGVDRGAFQIEGVFICPGWLSCGARGTDELSVQDPFLPKGSMKTGSLVLPHLSNLPVACSCKHILCVLKSL